MDDSRNVGPKHLALSAAWMPLAATLWLFGAPTMPASAAPQGPCAAGSMTIRMDPPDAAAPQVHLQALNGAERHWALRVLPAGTELFHWSREAQVAAWAARGQVPPAQAWLHAGGEGHYRGLWVSLHPFDAIDRGSHLLVATLLEPLRVVQVPSDGNDGLEPFDAFAQAAGLDAGDGQGCSWAEQLQSAGIGAMAQAPRTPRSPQAPWPDGLSVFDPEAFASSHGAQQYELMARLRTTSWDAPSLGLPVPILKLIALSRVAVHPSFSLAQLPLTFFDDAPWLHQALTHGTVQDELPTFCVKGASIDAKSYVCRWLPELPEWQPSALYRRLYYALCQDAAAAAEARSEET